MAFRFVIGLSIEEPALNRTTTQLTLVAAKVWASLYPSLKRKCGEFREELSIQTTVVTRWRSLGHKHAGSLRFAPYFSLRICAPKWGVMRRCHFSCV